MKILDECKVFEDDSAAPSITCTTSSVPMWSMPYTMGQCFAKWKFCQDGLGGRRIISSPSAVLGSSALSFCPAGLMNTWGKELLADEVDSGDMYYVFLGKARSIHSTRAGAELKICDDGLGGVCVITSPSAVLGASASSFCPVGLGLALDASC